MARNEDPTGSEGTKAGFPSHTRWTLIVAASGPTSSPEARAALDELCKLYWFPLYALIRREGYDSHQAKDLTQEFLGHVLETELFKKADARRGRFRSFLWESCRNFLKDEWRKGAAQKRGGGAVHPCNGNAHTIPLIFFSAVGNPFSSGSLKTSSATVRWTSRNLPAL